MVNILSEIIFARKQRVAAAQHATSLELLREDALAHDAAPNRTHS